MEACLIHLVKLAKAYPIQGAAARIVLLPTTTALPADRRLVVLGKKQEGKSAFMRMLAGVEAPTLGQVIPNVRLSPLIRAGGLFHPHLSGPENVRFCARTLDLDPDHLLSAVHEHIAGAPDDDSDLSEREQRKAMEVALLTVLGFNCYLIDEIGHLAEGVRHRHLDALSRCHCGVIFSTRQPRLARRYADCAVVIRKGALHAFWDVEEAIAFNGE